MSDRTEHLLTLLFRGAQAAAFTIPAELTTAARIQSTATDLRKAAGQRRHAAERSQSVVLAADAVLEALEAGTPPDIDAALGNALDEERAAQLAETVAIEVERRAQASSASTVNDLAETVLVDHLRPALAETVDAARKLAPSLAGLDPDNVQALLDAPKAAQDARRRLVGLADRRTAIYAAADGLGYWLGEPQHDDDGAFRRYRNAGALWGRQWPIRIQSQARGLYPWPAGPLANLVWAATSEAVPWLPLPAEEDEALAEFLREIKPGVLTGSVSGGPRRPWYAKGIVQPTGEVAS
jgi:hypothetical protein